MEQEQNIFREKAVNRISSADQIPDYLHATNVKVWVIFGVFPKYPIVRTGNVCYND